MTRLRQLWLLTALASLAVLAGGYFMLVSPKANEAAQVREEADTQLAANRKLSSDIAMLKQQAKDLPKKQAELAAFARQIPSNPALPQLIRALSDSADNAGSRLVAITPSEPQFGTGAGTAPVAAATATGPALAHIPLGVEVSGSYSALTQFFSEIEGMPRAFLVTGVNIKEAADSSPNSKLRPGDLVATINGRLFMSTTAPAAPTAATATAPAA